MRLRLFDKAGLVLAALSLTLGLLSPVPAHADFLHDAEQAVDDTHFFDFNMTDWQSELDACSGDNIDSCIDTVANKEGQSLPPDFEKMIDVYIDIREQAWGQLLTDGSEAVVCAALQVFAGGIDLCGAYGDFEKFVAATGGAIGKALTPAVNAFICENHIGGISCNQGVVPTYTAGVCSYGPGSWLPQSLTAQCNYGYQCSPGYQICNPGSPCYCSNCPAGQALQNGACAVCQSGGGGAVTTTSSAAWDGSHCIAQNTGFSCASGQYSTGTSCKPSCAPGDISDPSVVGGCRVCGPNSQALYSIPNSSVGQCVCKTGFNKDSHGTCGCGAGYLTLPPPGTCKMCPANTYQNFATCTPCADNQSSEPASTSCKFLSCRSGTHPANHQCVPNSVTLQPASGGGGPAIIKGRGDTSGTIGTAAPPTTSQENIVRCGSGSHAEGSGCVPGRLAPVPTDAGSQCPTLSRWTGEVCIGPRGKSFCPQGMTMQGQACVRVQTLECPPLSHSTGTVCVGPRGRSFCPAGMTMRDGSCVR
jgi:hypothetical protein